MGNLDKLAMAVRVERDRAGRFRAAVHVRTDGLEPQDRIVEDEQGVEVLQPFGDPPPRLAGARARVFEQGPAVRHEPPGHPAPGGVVLQPGKRAVRRRRLPLQLCPPSEMEVQKA